jgi:ribosomal protein S18 acetylase RimI-like enzyme
VENDDTLGHVELIRAPIRFPAVWASLMSGLMSEIVIRPAVPDDLDALWEFLAMASYEPNGAAAKAVPMVATYLDDWPRPGDFGLIAERNGVAVGAACARQFSSTDEKFQFGDRTPELSIGVSAHVRGMGIGEMLLRALIAEASARGLGLGLNVRLTNAALRLYERLGFRAVPGMIAPNRAGGQSIGMLLDANRAA